MKNLSWITGVLIFVMVTLAVLGSVCGAVDQIAADENFYGSMSRAAAAKYLAVEGDAQQEAQVTAYIGLSAEEQAAFAKETAAFMAGETDALPQILNEDEKQHMLDVRAITQGIAGMSGTYFSIAGALAVVAAWTGAKLKNRWKSKLAGSLSAVALLMLVVKNLIDQISAGGFAQLFVQLHEALFTNDLWLMDPAEDILIRMMPQPLFEQALLNGASIALRMAVIVLAMLIALHFIVESMIRRHLKKK